MREFSRGSLEAVTQPVRTEKALPDGWLGCSAASPPQTAASGLTSFGPSHPTCLLTPLRAFFFCLATAFLAGCGGSSDNRTAVAGRVTLDGNPLTTGSINFVPTAGGFSAGAKIVNGDFELDRDVGPSPGKYRVQITAYQPTGRKIQDPDVPGSVTDEIRQVLPPRYNYQTTLEVTLEAGRNDELSFELESARR